MQTETTNKNGKPNLSELVSRSKIDLLIVDDEREFRETAYLFFRKLGYRVEQAEDADEAINLAKQRRFDVAVLDIHMPGMSGIDLLKRLRTDENDLQAIMLTGGGTIENAVESMKCGASDFFTKPVKLADLDIHIQKAYQNRELSRENKTWRHIVQTSSPPIAMIGKSPAMEQVYRMIEKTAKTDKPVLIQGESGTGKELVARALHRASHRADKPLVVINCAALPEPLLESELFGHEKGSFTGAIATKQGMFEVADGGTLFIDEFGELAGSLQAKLLRVLEDGTLRRVGSVKELRVDVRLICATNRDLTKDVAEGRFREDLFYRVNVLTIQLPPLRERAGDIELLIRHFVGQNWTISDELVSSLAKYNWPGNVRQLYNAIERAKILSDDKQITAENLPREILDLKPGSVQSVVGSGIDLETLNRMHVVKVFEQHHRNKAQTARALGIGRRSLYRLLEKYAIE
jgi:DNA-binding NtrC family response regulator